MKMAEIADYELLEYLAEKGDFEKLKKLIEAGINTKPRRLDDLLRNRAFDKAVIRNNVKCAQLLYACGTTQHCDSGPGETQLRKCGIEPNESDLSLGSLCKKYIRAHLLGAAGHGNLIAPVAKLPVPNQIKNQLVHNIDVFGTKGQ